MLDTISKAFNIYPGEARLVSLMLLYSFSLGIVKAYFLTAASALFLEQFDSASVAAAAAGGAGAGGVAGGGAQPGELAGL